MSGRAGQPAGGTIRWPPLLRPPLSATSSTPGFPPGRISFWLLPEPAAETVLRPWIAALAPPGLGPFPPHVTVLAGPDPGEPALAAALEEAAALFRAPLRHPWPEPEAGTDGDPWFCLFLPLPALHPALRAPREALARHLDAEPPLRPPHLSLAYGTPPAAPQTPAALPRDLFLDRLAAVSVSGPPPEWRILLERPLGPAPERA